MLKALVSALTALVLALTTSSQPVGEQPTPTQTPAAAILSDDPATEIEPTATTPPALQCVRIVYSGNIRTCAEWGPAQPIPTPTPFTGYP